MCDCNNKLPKHPLDVVTHERKPHVHADVIKAWADGAIVQVKCPSDWFDCSLPKFFETEQYRVKPEPKAQTDLEKYGVQVGDMWINRTRGMITHIYGLDGSDGISIFYQESARPAAGVRCELHTLLFRRGVVNKLGDC